MYTASFQFHCLHCVYWCSELKNKSPKDCIETRWAIPTPCWVLDTAFLRVPRTVLGVLGSRAPHFLGQFLFLYSAVWGEDFQMLACSLGLCPGVSMIFFFYIFLLSLWWHQPSISHGPLWMILTFNSSSILTQHLFLLLSHVQEMMCCLSPCGSWGARVTRMKRFPEVDGGEGLSDTSKCLQ